MLLRFIQRNKAHRNCKYYANNSVEILFKVNQADIQLTFKDKGIGIPESEVKKIFEPFFRATNAGNWIGSGLGLSLTQKIIELHKGTIQIQTEVNKGTEINIILPTITSC